MKELEKFGQKILELDPEELKQELGTGRDGLFMVRDLDDRFRFTALIKGKPYYSTFYVYNGMREEEEKKAFMQAVQTLKTGWFPTVTEKGHSWQCAYCDAVGQSSVVANFNCPCRPF